MSESGRIKHYVSNLLQETPVATMVALAHRRWMGRHHHVTLCFMAFCFLLLLQYEGGGKIEEVSLPTVKRFLNNLLQFQSTFGRRYGMLTPARQWAF